MLENDQPIISTPSSPEKALELLISSEYSFNNVFRGQNKSSWGLVSTLGRIHQVNNDYSGLNNSELRAYDYFVRHAQKLLTNPPKLNDVTTWMIMMQHYGAPTRLLDWTGSPFVALYFAYKPNRDNEDDDEDVSIYILSETGTKNAVKPLTTKEIVGRSIWDASTLDLLYSGEQENTLANSVVKGNNKYPLLVYPRIPDARIANQKGVLTICANEKAAIPFPLKYQFRPLPPIMISGSKPSPRPPLPPPVNLLWKLNLPWEWRAEILNRLDRMGFNDSTLFPNLEGLGRYSKWLVDGYEPISTPLAAFYNEIEED